MGRQFQDIAEQPQLRCDTRAQERQATYIGAVSGRRNYVPGFDSLFVAVPRPEPKNSSAAQGVSSFDLIARQERNLLKASAQEPTPGGPEKAFDKPILHWLRKAVEHVR